MLSKSLYSVALKKKIKLRVTAKVLKTMDREGGLDEYLLKDDAHRLKELGPLGWALRCTLIQRPEVRERLRAEAAALGVDQETIDKQWPTQEMLAQQKGDTRGLVRAADLIGEETEEFDQGVEDLDDMEEETFGEGPEEPTTLSLTSPTTSEKSALRAAVVEYTRALAAAQRYLDRSWVDTLDSGLKLAFIRSKDRAELTATNKRNFFTEKLKQRSSRQELQETRTRFNLPPSLNDYAVSKIAYNQWRRKEVEKVGSYDAWRAGIDKEKGAKQERLIEETGGKEVWHAEKKGMYAQMIEEAENAAANDTLDAGRRAYLEDAIQKAGRAIRARADGGAETYAELKLKEMRMRGELKSSRSKRRNEAGGDAWSALINASNDSSAERRPHA